MGLLEQVVASRPRGVGHTTAACGGGDPSRRVVITANNAEAKRISRDHGVIGVGLESLHKLQGKTSPVVFDLFAVQRIVADHAAALEEKERKMHAAVEFMREVYQEAQAQYKEAEAERDKRIAELESQLYSACDECGSDDPELDAKCPLKVAHKQIAELETEAEFSTKVTNEQAALIEAQAQRIKEWESSIELFDDELCCPECNSFDVSEVHYEDDFSSSRCRACGFVGEPGEDFPSTVRVRQRIAKLEKCAEVLREMNVPDGVEFDWWCPACRSLVDATFEEHCASCGHYLTDCQPSQEWASKRVQALSDLDALEVDGE